MLRDAAVDLLMTRLGNRKDEALRNDIIAEMVQAQETVLEGDTFKPWFLVSEEASSETIVGDERVALPADWLAPWEYGGLYRYDVALADPYIEMGREDWDEIKECLNYSGTPTHYDISGKYLLMRPLADAVYPLRMWYIQRAATLAGVYGDANNIENVWLKWASDWLLGEVGMIIGGLYLQMPDAKLTGFSAQITRGRERIRVLNVAHEEALKKRVMR